jgi:ABC-2 type transport system ATP-binding protein
MLEIENIQCEYGAKKVLNQISCSFENGHIYGILGKNGAGKTTLFNTLFGFKKPSHGRLLFHQKPILKSQISFLETNSFFYPMMTGMEYLKLIKEDLQTILRWNKLFDLPLDEYAENYSTGMKKKLAFLGVFIQDRPIWILDEPFNGVDIESNEKLMQIIERFRSKDRMILISSHILSMLTRVCDRIDILDEGKFTSTYQKEHFQELEDIFQSAIKDELDDLLSLTA